jgi:hypothetical protein
LVQRPRVEVYRLSARPLGLDLLQLPVFKEIDQSLRCEECLQDRIEGGGSGLGGELPVTFADILGLQVFSEDLTREGTAQGIEIDALGNARNVLGLNGLGEVVERNERLDHEDGPA